MVVSNICSIFYWFEFEKTTLKVQHKLFFYVVYIVCLPNIVSDIAFYCKQIRILKKSDLIDKIL